MATQGPLDTSPSRPTQHGALTAGAELAAYTICKAPPQLAKRKRVRGFAIDSADPYSPMDRDDAVSIRFDRDSVHGYVATLDVSIADVASISPHVSASQHAQLAALDAFAFHKGESLYFNHGVSPMLPRRLQDRLSLEHEKERAAVTISVTLDRHCNPIHTELARTRIKTICRSYRDAARDILMHGHPIQQISVVATQLLKRKSGITNLPHYDEKTGIYTDAEGNVRHISHDELSAFTTVQGSMIAANEAAAQLMSQSHFLFRNHSYSFRNSPLFYRKDAMEQFAGSEGRVIQNKAEYSPVCRGHFGLDALQYSHVTSPMRRYADLVNQRMMLWAIDVIEAIIDSMVGDAHWNHKKYSRKQVAYRVWDYAPEILGRACAFKQARVHVARHQGNLEHAIASMIAGMGHYELAAIVKNAAEAIARIDLPYTAKDLQRIAEALNETLAGNRAMRREMQVNETNLWLDKVFPAPDAPMLKAWGAEPFSRLLAAAARRGDNHAVFAAEVLLRLKEDADYLVPNLCSILAIARMHKDSHWQELKKQAFQILKDGPELGEQLFAHLQKQREFSPQRHDGEAKSITQIVMVETLLRDRHNRSHPSALVVLVHGEHDYSAPVIDTAETAQKARQAAILTFFRHYGDLYPHQQLYTPKLIDLALERAKVKKGERLALLEKISAPYFTVEVQRKTYAQSPRRLEINLVIKHSQSGQTLHKSRTGGIEACEQIIDKTAKDMLEDRRLHDLLSQCPQWSETQHEVMEPDDKMPPFAWDTYPIDRRHFTQAEPA